MSKRILFITSTRIGDAVLSTGILGRLLRQHPGALVTVVTGPLAAPLFADLPGLERIIVLNKKPFSTHWLEMWAASIGTFWDVVVDLRNAPLSHLLFSRKAYHLGRAGRMNVHRVVSLGSVIGINDTPPPPHLWVGPDRIERATGIIPDGTAVLGLGPAANWPGKIWPGENFAELALRLTADNGILPGARIAVFAHESERAIAQPVIDRLRENSRTVIDVVSNNHLLDVQAALLRLALFIGNDSGLMHMAAAGGVGVLGLFGPSNDELYGPWGEKCRAIRTKLSFAEALPPGLDVHNCGSRMTSLGVDAAEKAACELWANIN